MPDPQQEWLTARSPGPPWGKKVRPSGPPSVVPPSVVPPSGPPSAQGGKRKTRRRKNKKSLKRR